MEVNSEDRGKIAYYAFFWEDNWKLINTTNKKKWNRVFDAIKNSKTVTDRNGKEILILEENSDK